MDSIVIMVESQLCILNKRQLTKTLKIIDNEVKESSNRFFYRIKK